MDTDRSTITRVLAVADWAVDPHAVVAAMSRQAEVEPTIFGLLVTAQRGFPSRLKFDLDSRIERITGLPVERRRISQPPVPRRRRGHCSPAVT
jgi:hypothetical protein